MSHERAKGDFMKDIVPYLVIATLLASAAVAMWGPEAGMATFIVSGLAYSYLTKGKP